jgi:prepilin-type N-terminal cleavage/methylation domain-containing protein
MSARLSHRREGFTLIELLIVVVIIGVLASIAIPKFANTKDQAYSAQLRSDLRNLARSRRRTSGTTACTGRRRRSRRRRTCSG